MVECELRTHIHLPRQGSRSPPATGERRESEAGRRWEAIMLASRNRQCSRARRGAATQRKEAVCGDLRASTNIRANVREGSGTPPPGENQPVAAAGLGLQLKLPCAWTSRTVQARYADESGNNNSSLAPGRPPQGHDGCSLERTLRRGDPGSGAGGNRMRSPRPDAPAVLRGRRGERDDRRCWGTPPGPSKWNPASGAAGQRRARTSGAESRPSPPFRDHSTGPRFSRPVPPPPRPDAMPAGGLHRAPPGPRRLPGRPPR